jgi:hypothetical protein
LWIEDSDFGRLAVADSGGGRVMALFDNGIKMGTGIAIGLGAIILAPTVLSAVGAIIKPLAKAGIKTALMVFDKGREMAAETVEVFEDLTAEARAELAAEASAAREAAAQVVVPEEGTV